MRSTALSATACVSTGCGTASSTCRAADRWVGLARNALREDVEAEHRAVVDAVLRTADATLDADAAFDEWAATQPAAVERTLALVDDIAAHGVFDLATLSVALRELRALT